MNTCDESADLTRLIQQAMEGNREVENQLLRILYVQLRRQAQHVVSNAPVSIAATQLVHDIWMRIFQGPNDLRFSNRRVFFAYAARAMRNLLTDIVKRRKAAKRGGKHRRTPVLLDALADQCERLAAVDLLALNEALETLRLENERQFRTVELRFFGGLSMSEIAQLHGVSKSVAEQDWVVARAKLRHRLRHLIHD